METDRELKIGDCVTDVVRQVVIPKEIDGITVADEVNATVVDDDEVPHMVSRAETAADAVAEVDGDVVSFNDIDAKPVCDAVPDDIDDMEPFRVAKLDADIVAEGHRVMDLAGVTDGPAADSDGDSV